MPSLQAAFHKTPAHATSLSSGYSTWMISTDLPVDTTSEYGDVVMTSPCGESYPCETCGDRQCCDLYYVEKGFALLEAKYEERTAK